MTRNILFLTIALFCSVTSYCQITNVNIEDYEYTNWKKHIVSIRQIKDSIQLLHIHDITVEDVRPDTMAVGLEQHVQRKPRFLLMEDGLTQTIQKLVNGYVRYGNSDSASVVMVISKLWLTGGMDPISEYPGMWNTHEDTVQTVSNLVVRIDYLLRTGAKYNLLCRYDTVLTASYKHMDTYELLVVSYGPTATVSRSANRLVEEAIAGSLIKLAKFDSLIPSGFVGRRKFNNQEVEAYYKKPYGIPILNDKSFTAGVYMNFEEFKTNSPSGKNYEIVKDIRADLISVKQKDGKFIPMKDAWGYCDGHQLYIRSGSNYFLLQRRSNNFYIFGNKRLTRPQYRIAPYVSHGNQRFYVELRPYVLDWDSGGIY